MRDYSDAVAILLEKIINQILYDLLTFESSIRRRRCTLLTRDFVSGVLGDSVIIHHSSICRNSNVPY
jgi:hypothetical protein